MTRKEALAELIAKVEAGEDVLPLAYKVADQTGHVGRYVHIVDAYNGSLDAALALHQAVLPSARVHDLSQFERGWACVLNGDIPPHFFYGDADTPARAWLLAILKALHEMETEQ